MPTPATRANGAPEVAPMPKQVRIAVVTMGVLAALLLLNAALTWYGRASLAAALLTARTDMFRADAERLVLLWMLPYLVVGLILALAAWYLPRGQAWARWFGLAASTLLALLTLFSVVSSGGVTAASLLLLLLSVATVTCLLSKKTAAWVPSLRSGN
ncbi:MAG: hypothetical protein ACXVX0_05325 [Blastococcus sp.]